MTVQLSRRLLSRLHRDLAELHDHPYPGVAIFTDDADLRKFCLVLTPPSGPWTGLSLHFDVELPEDWPSIPPKVASSVEGIEHPNLFGRYICCDLLKPMDWLERGYTGGYTPALTLRGLFLQFLTFFSSTSVEQDYGGSIEIGDYALTSFMRERDVANLQHPWERCCRNRHPCACKPLKEGQLVLEKEWNANPVPETVISKYSSGSEGQVVHKVKKLEPSANRIHKFEQPNPKWSSTLKLISAWSCRKCPYGSADLPHRQSNSLITMKDAIENALCVPPDICLLPSLNDDTLAEIASHMPSESLISLGLAYPRFRLLTSGWHILLHRELHCFFLKTPFQESILGVGVAFDARPRTLSSDFDWLSKDAFEHHSVRKSIQKRDFQFFLPLAFNRSHFERARPHILTRLNTLHATVTQADTDMKSRQNGGGNGRGRGRGRGGFQGQGRGGGFTPPSTPSVARPIHETVGVVYKMMNNIVVSLMKSCDDALTPQNEHASKATLLHASERAVISYCHLMHLLICLCRSYPVILKDATNRLQTFIQAPGNRIKATVPDMGELIVLVTLVLIMPPVDNSTPLSWSMLSGPFLEEATIRNVRWVLKDAPELEILEQEGVNEYRLATTFSKSKTSLRLMMFQITFLDLFIKTYSKLGIVALDDNYGFAEKELPEKMVQEIKEIYKVDNFPGYFRKVQYATGMGFTKERFSEMLRQAMRTSKERKYHEPAHWKRLDELAVIRKQLERARAEAQAKR